jgi:hypothetical protein
MKPTPLPPHPKFIDRIEHAIESSFCWTFVDFKGRPVLSGLCSAVLMMVETCAMILAFTGLVWVIRHFL